MKTTFEERHVGIFGIYVFKVKGQKMNIVISFYCDTCLSYTTALHIPRCTNITYTICMNSRREMLLKPFSTYLFSWSNVTNRSPWLHLTIQHINFHNVPKPDLVINRSQWLNFHHFSMYQHISFIILHEIIRCAPKTFR